MARDEQFFDYNEDNVWDYLRGAQNINLEDYATQEDLERAIDDAFSAEPLSGEDPSGKGGVGSIKSEGRRKVKDLAVSEWEGIEKRKPKVEELEEVTPEELPERRPRARAPRAPRGAVEPIEAVEIPKVKVPKQKLPRKGVGAIPEELAPPRIETPDETTRRTVEEIEKKVEERTRGSRINAVINDTAVGIRNRIADIVQGLADRIRGKKKEEEEEEEK